MKIERHCSIGERSTTPRGASRPRPNPSIERTRNGMPRMALISFLGHARPAAACRSCQTLGSAAKNGRSSSVRVARSTACALAPSLKNALPARCARGCAAASAKLKAVPCSHAAQRHKDRPLPSVVAPCSITPQHVQLQQPTLAVRAAGNTGPRTKAWRGLPVPQAGGQRAGICLAPTQWHTLAREP